MVGDFREADYTLPDHVLQSPVNDDRWDERGSEVETAPDPLPRPFPEPRAGVWSASACLGGCFWEGPSIHLLVTSCWVFSGWLLVAVDSGGTVVLVSQDGIQRPPFRFPKGGHLLQFLSCLENGLLPHGQLDPPLWSQRGKVSECGVEWGARGGGVCLWVLIWLLGSRMPARTLRLYRLEGRCAQGPCARCVLSGQSISQTAQAKPSGFRRVHIFRQGR